MKKTMVRALVLFILVASLISIVYHREIRTMAGWPDAVKGQSRLAVKLHLLLGADVNAVKPGFKTPIEEAFWLKANPAIINELLDHKPDLAKLVDKKSSLLAKAISMLDFAKVPTDKTIIILRRLLEFGEDINFVERNTTPLFTAARIGRPDLVKFLLEAGADPSAVIKDGDGPFETTIFDQLKHPRSHEVMEVLLNSGATLNLQSMLVAAVIAKNMQAVKMLVKKGASLNHKVEEKYMTLLMHAALVFDEAQVKEFVELGADINIADNFGRNVLATCIQQEKYDLAKFFIEKGTSVNYVDNSGESLLSYFIENQKDFKDLNDMKRRTTFLGFLKRNGLNINFQNPKTGRTAVMRVLNLKKSDIASVWMSMLVSMKDANDSTDPFYVQRGVRIHSVEVRSVSCKEESTQGILQEIIQETTNRLNRLQKQQSENEVRLNEVKGNFEIERQLGALLEIQRENALKQAKTTGESEAVKVAQFFETLSDALSEPEKINIFNTLKKVEYIEKLGRSNANMFFTPNDVNLSIETHQKS